MRVRVLRSKADWDEARTAITESGDCLVVRDQAFRIWTVFEDYEDYDGFCAVRAGERDDDLLDPDSPRSFAIVRRMDATWQPENAAVLWWPGSVVIQHNTYSKGTS